jgi:hypothetical protein
MSINNDRERNACKRVGGALLAVMLLVSPAVAQTATPPKPATDAPPAAANETSEPKAPAASAEAPKPLDTSKMSPKEARQAQIAADTERLYQLAQELKAEVAKSNKDTLSLTVIKKAAEVEKLAHSLKDQMKSE